MLKPVRTAWLSIKTLIRKPGLITTNEFNQNFEGKTQTGVDPVDMPSQPRTPYQASEGKRSE